MLEGGFQETMASVEGSSTMSKALLRKGGGGRRRRDVSTMARAIVGFAGSCQFCSAASKEGDEEGEGECEEERIREKNEAVCLIKLDCCCSPLAGRRNIIMFCFLCPPAAICMYVCMYVCMYHANDSSRS